MSSIFRIRWGRGEAERGKQKGNKLSRIRGKSSKEDNAVIQKNKAENTAQDAPSARLKIAGDGRTDERTHPLIEMRRRI